MMKNIFAAIFTLLALSPPATAGDFYLAIDVGQSVAKDVCSGVPSGLSCSNSAAAYRLGAGYSFNRNVAAEANVSFLGDYATERVGGGVLVTDHNYPLAYQFAVIGSYPLSDAFSLIGKLGISTSSMTVTTAVTTENTSRTQIGYGIGGQFGLSETVALRAQYESLGEVAGVRTVGAAKVSLISAGIVSTF